MKRLRIASALALAAALLPVLTAAPGAAAPVALKTLELGKGPPIVLLHGLGGTRLQWMPVAKRLLATHRVILVDLPGHGDSPMPDPFTLQAAADAVDAVLAGEKERVVLVGHSVGGAIALLEASAHPEHVRGLVVLDAAAKSPTEIPDQQKKQYEEIMDQRYDELLRMSFNQLARDSAQSAAAFAEASQVPAATMKAYLRQELYYDGSAAARDLKVPLLYLGSEKMWPADSAAGDSARHAIPWPVLARRMGYDGVKSATARRMTGASHFMMLDQPDTLAAVLADFAARLPGK